jgi:hypothetical protein
MQYVKMILEIVALSIIVLFVYNALKIYVLGKLKINKWFILAAAIIILVAQSIVNTKYKNDIVSYIFTALFVILFLWFMDTMGWGAAKPKANNSVVIKPKAKPNRIKDKKIK